MEQDSEKQNNITISMDNQKGQTINLGDQKGATVNVESHEDAAPKSATTINVDAAKGAAVNVENKQGTPINLANLASKKGMPLKAPMPISYEFNCKNNVYFEAPKKLNIVYYSVVLLCIMFVVWAYLSEIDEITKEQH